MTYQTLKLSDPMMHGPAVRRLQEMLTQLGYDCGQHDGIYGEDTADRVLCFQMNHLLSVDGICGPKTWSSVFRSLELYGNHAEQIEGVCDIRANHSPPKLYKCRRPPSIITGVTLHQTGCEMPKDPDRWGRLNAHIGVTQEGKVVIVNDPLDWIWHAQGLSKTTIGIEFEGNYFGVDGDAATLWKGGGGPHHITTAMERAFPVLFEWLKNWFDNRGIDWQHIHAHRQSAVSRIADPGEEIWKAVAIPWMEWTGATDGGPGFRRGKGRGIPHQWSGDRNAADYYWTP